MGYLRVLILTLAALLCLSPTAQAVGQSGTSDPLYLEGLKQAAGEYAPAADIETGVDFDQGLQDLMKTGAEQVGGIVKAALKSAVLLILIVLFCSLAEGVGSAGTAVFQAAPVAGVLAVCAVSVADVHSLIGLGRQAVDAMADFATVLLPTMAAAAAAGGTPVSAAARQMATALFSDLLIQAISKILIPVVYLYVTACALFAAVGNPGIKRLAKTLKGLITGTLTALLLAFVGYLSISGVIAGSTDAVTVKTAKAAISGMVPVVGSVLSDAAETVLAGAGILKGTVGAFGSLVILGICLTPFLQMGIHYLVYKLAATLSATLLQGRVVDLVDSITSAFALVLGMTASCAMLLLFSVISCLSAAGVT